MRWCVTPGIGKRKIRQDTKTRYVHSGVLPLVIYLRRKVPMRDWKAIASFVRQLYATEDDFIALHEPGFVGNEKAYLEDRKSVG